MQDKIFEILFDKDEVTWQTMLYDLVRTEQMDPWDIDIALLAQKFFEMVKLMKEMDFRVSGKILLAAALLLKIKSTYLLDKDVLAFDQMFAEPSEEEGLLDDSEDIYAGEREKLKEAELIPRTPQPRKRKVSIFDLVDALQRAVEVKRRRVMRDIPPLELEVPKRKIDISAVIKDMYGRITAFFAAGKGKLTFTKLCPSEDREDKVHTFIPLLHLTHQRKIDLYQYQHFGEIEIAMLKKEIDKELGS
jgi:segregation and condensation protein A